MDLTFNVHMRIARPVATVFEAVADPVQLSRYFTTGGASARLEPGTTVTWDFADFPGAFPVEVVEVVPNRRIVLRWDGGEEGGSHYPTRVEMSFVALEDGGTLVGISESGWRETQSGVKAALGNNGGWMHMLCCLKAWLEHGINLRDGGFAPGDDETLAASRSAA